MHRIVPIALTTVVAAPLAAAELEVSIELPRLGVAEYNRPYLGLWIEQAGGDVVADLAVWYDVAQLNYEGERWLTDLRQWWRRIGRDLQLPVDGVTGATRAPGKHTLQYPEGVEPLGKLAPGRYELVVEAARELGGRELLRVPFTWPVKAPFKASVQGASELGQVTLGIKP